MKINVNTKYRANGHYIKTRKRLVNDNALILKVINEKVKITQNNNSVLVLWP